MRTSGQVFELSIGSSSSASSGLHNAHGLIDFGGSSSSSLLGMGPPDPPQEVEKNEQSTAPGTPDADGDRAMPRTPKSAESADVRMLITEALLSPMLHIQQSPTTSMARSSLAKIPSSKYVHTPVPAPVPAPVPVPCVY